MSSLDTDVHPPPPAATGCQPPASFLPPSSLPLTASASAKSRPTNDSFQFDFHAKQPEQLQETKEQYPPSALAQPPMFPRPKLAVGSTTNAMRPNLFQHIQHQHLYGNSTNTLNYGNNSNGEGHPLGTLTPMTMLANDLGASLMIRNTPANPMRGSTMSTTPLLPLCGAGNGNDDMDASMDDIDPLALVAVSPSGSPNSISFQQSDEDADLLMDQTLPTPSSDHPMLATPCPARRPPKFAMPRHAGVADTDEAMAADDEQVDPNVVSSPASLDPTTPCPRPRPRTARQACSALSAEDEQLANLADPGADSGVLLADDDSAELVQSHTHMLTEPIEARPPPVSMAANFAINSTASALNRFGFPRAKPLNERTYQSTAARPGLNRSRSEATLPLAGRKRSSFMAFAASPPHPPGASASFGAFGSRPSRSTSNLFSGRGGSSSSFSSSNGSSFTGIAPPSLSDDEDDGGSHGAKVMDAALDQGYYEVEQDVHPMDVSDTPLGARRPMKRTRFSSPAASPLATAMAMTRRGTVAMQSVAATPARETQSDGEQQESEDDDDEPAAATPSIRRPAVRRTKSVGYLALQPGSQALPAGPTGPSMFTFSLPPTTGHACGAGAIAHRAHGPHSPRPAGEPLLPSTLGKSDSIRRITPATLADVLDGRVPGVTEFRVLDVRFPFEYEGGHIAGALNVNSFEDLDAMFFTGGLMVPRAMHSTVFIFHCEFSSHRAPAMAMHLRAQDRIANMARYPDVFYPEIYVLEGGYKRFWTELPHRCTPHGAYIPMDHEEYRELCKHEVTQRKLSLARSKSSNDAFAPSLNRTKSNGGLPAIPASPGSPCMGVSVRQFKLPGLVRAASALVVPGARLESGATLAAGSACESPLGTPLTSSFASATWAESPI